MRRFACLLVSILVAAAGAVAAMASSASSPVPRARSARSCRSIHAGGFTLEVKIIRGRVSCREARKVLGAFLTGKGTQHGGGSSATTYWTLYDWRCSHGGGGGACLRRGSNYRTARDYIEASVS
jgi:hypothetical protein